VDGERYAAPLRLDERHQGGPGIAHGGIVSAALDEAMGILAQHVAFPSVTARFLVRYRKPVPTGEELQLEARLARTTGQQRRFDASLTCDEQVLADAEGWFLEVPLAHFLRYRRQP
jgi:acyl-coenzyme A thioesterase PaaI-like protein